LIPLHNFDRVKREILDRLSILDVVQDHVTMKRRGRRWVGLCPFHAEKTPSFTVQPEMGIFKCFGCGKGGDLFSFVQHRENIDFKETLRTLADRAGVAFETAPASTESTGPGRSDLARVNAWAAGFYRARLLDPVLGRSACEYLIRRGISPATSEKFQLGLAVEGKPGLRESAARAGISPALLEAADFLRRGEDGSLYETFRNRLMFPIKDAMNRVLGFGGRTLVDDRAKYLNTRQTSLFDKGRGLYGLDVARPAMSEKECAVLVEGYMDCIAAHQAGFTETVATSGTALSEKQIDLLRRYCNSVVILFDSDEAGKAAADRAILVALPRCITVRLARIPQGKDPCDFLSASTPDAFSVVLNGAVDALEFVWLETERHFREREGDAARRDAVEEFLRLVAAAFAGGAVNVIERGLIVNRVARLLGMEPSAISRHLARMDARKPTSRDSTTATPEKREDSRGISTRESRSAWANVLGVLLNEPGLASTIDAMPEIFRGIGDSRDRRIAEWLVELTEAAGEFPLTEVLSRCHDPGDAERVAELARRGRERGNYENTLRVELERIRQAQLTVVVSRISDGESIDRSAARPVVDIGTVHRSMSVHRHFAPRRLIRRVADEGAEPKADSPIVGGT